MKLIKIRMVLCGMCIGLFTGAAAQITDIKYAMTSGSDSLVRVAYGTVDKKDLSGAISVLNPTEYLDKHYGTYPLDGTNAFIGGSNLWGIGGALVLVDGVPRAITDVTSAEIAQITFLKGANAVVLYGSRAANGVIMITTKRGKADDNRKTVRVNAGINTPKAYPEYLGSAEYMTYYNQACRNDGLAALYDDATISKYAAHTNPYRYADVNYYSSDYLRKLSNAYSGNAEFSGGTQRARFYALIGMQTSNSLLNFGEGKKENSSRLNIRGNIDLKLNDFISTYVNVAAAFYDNRTALGNYWNQAANMQPQRFSPLIPIGLIDPGAESALVTAGSSRNVINGQYLLGGTQQYLTNPIADVYAAGHNTFTSRQFQYTGGVDVDLRKALQGLSVHGQMSVDYSNSYNQAINHTYAVFVPTWNGGEAVADTITGLTKYNKDKRDELEHLNNPWNDQVIDFNVHADYVNTFNAKHNVSAILVAAGMLRRQTGDFQYRTNTNVGLQLAYNFNHKYYADFSGAVVNSTKLSASQRVAFSPTVSLGWLLSGEDFLKGSEMLNRLKLTASAGIINTDLDFDNYYLGSAIYTSNAYYSWRDGGYTNQATSILRGENQKLTFVKRNEFNVGLEGTMFKNTVDIKATAFVIEKDGLPGQSNTLYPSYFTSFYPATSFVPYTNYGANRYQGGDFQLNFHTNVGKVKLAVGAAGTYVDTKVLKRDELYVDSYRNRTGKPTDALFGLQSEGLFADQSEIDNHSVQKFGTVKPGDIKYKDQNGDNVIDEKDEVMIGRWGSPFTCGMNFTAQWKGFTLFALGTGSFGGTAIKSGDYYWVNGSKKYSAVVRDSWTEETKNTAAYPRLTTLSADNNFRNSDFWAYSTDRINLSKVQLTYSLPKKRLNNSFVKGINIYVSGSDLLTIAKNRDVLELNVGSSPQTRFYNLGVKAEF